MAYKPDNKKEKKEVVPFNPENLRRTSPSGRNVVKVKAEPRDLSERGRKQTYRTHDEELARARMWQYAAPDLFKVVPIQMPTRREPVRYSVALPRYFLEDLNEAKRRLSRFGGQMRLVFEKLWTDSSDFREWLPEEVYHRVSRMKSDERANFLAGLLDDVVRNASQIIGQNGLLLELTPADYTARRTAVNNVADFAWQAGKFYGFIRSQLDSANKAAPSGSKSHVPDGESRKRRSSKSKKQRAADYAARSAAD